MPPPHFIVTIPLLSFRVGLCSYEIFFCRLCGSTVDIRCDRNKQKGCRSRGPESTRSSSWHVRKMGISETQSTFHLATRGFARRLQSSTDKRNQRRSWSQVVVHDSTDFVKSDGKNHIAEWTARILRRNSSLKTDVFPLCISSSDPIVKKLSDFERGS